MMPSECPHCRKPFEVGFVPIIRAALEGPQVAAAPVATTTLAQPAQTPAPPEGQDVRDAARGRGFRAALGAPWGSTSKLSREAFLAAVKALHPPEDVKLTVLVAQITSDEELGRRLREGGY